MLIGNSIAPRWHEQNSTRLDQYLGFLAGAGATSAELVLHHGPMDARGLRVHVLEADWLTVSRKIQAAGLACQLHASLDRRFDLARWETDRSGLQAEYRPLIAAAIAISECQPATAGLVVHATSSAGQRAQNGIANAKGFLEWAAGLLASAEANVVLCPELRRARSRSDSRWDRTRSSMTEVIAELCHPKIGICWDLGHDWENRCFEDNWTPIPSGAFLKLVRHVHLHDAGADGSLHHPLGTGRIPWAAQLRVLCERDYAGAATMEIRYRYALAAGEPWTVLAASYRRAKEQLG